MKIGVFDSGIGGKAVAEELRRLLPHAEILFVSDHGHVPYGGRPRYEIIQLTKAAIQPLLAAACDVIVIACNTATTNVIQVLRAEYRQQKFIGLEPMVKPAAAETKTGKIAVLATPATLQSPRYQQLKDEWAHYVTVFEPDCSIWAGLIENGRSDEIPIKETVAPLLANGVDVIVLGCTHYHWIKELVQKVAGPSVTILEPTNAIRNRIVDITTDYPSAALLQ
ncbi:MAG TPA: aspartate/glutamate racemase family protein [Dongiaceae bacterium]|nr:aspartate/glutamate racemase family protein [Dongiaceae bacterium]